MNTVNTTNFNQTAMGYLEIALSHTKLSEDEKLDVTLISNILDFLLNTLCSPPCLHYNT